MVKNKDRKVIGIVGIVLALALLFFVAGDRFLAVTGASDMSILSISETIINGEPAIKILATANGGAELLDIDFGEDYLNNYLEQYDLEATESITGSIKVGKQSIEFPYASTGNIIYKSVKIRELGTFISCSQGSCEEGLSTNEDVLDYRRLGFFTTGYRCVCLIGSEKADVGKWSEIDKKDYDVTFTIDGLGSTTINRDLQSLSLEEANLGSYAKIKFQGLLGSYDNVKQPSYTPFLYNNQINLLEPTSYTNIKTAYNRLFDDAFFVVDIWDVNSYNGKIRSYFVDRYNFYESQSYIESASRDSSGVKIILEHAIDYPVFTITLNAEKVGIIEQFGQPSDLVCSRFEFKANELGQSQCSVKNSGNAGAFRVDLSNCDGITAFITGGNNLGSFNAEESKDFTVTVQGTTDNPNGESVNCNVRVYDMNEPSNDDTYKVYGTVMYNPGGLCSPVGNLVCSENMKNLMECNTDGDYRLKSECAYGCTYGNDGQALCSSDDDDDDDTKCDSCWDWARNKIEPGYCTEGFLDKYFLSPFKCIIYFVKLAFLSILSLVGFFVIQGNLLKIKSIRRTPIISWLLSGVIISILALVGYMFLTSILFYFIIFGLIAFQIAVSLIPGARYIRPRRPSRPRGGYRDYPRSRR